jgi:CHAD domain-containing protein
VLAADSVAEAGRKVLRFHLARMVAREPGTREGNVEELHGMRVATRRQRAAWRIFGPAYRRDRTKAHRVRLRLIGAMLGAVRDLDVLIAGVEDYLAPLPATDRLGLEPMLARWRADRDAARVRLVRELDSAGHRRWLERYAAFVETEGKHALPSEPAAPHRVVDTAGSRIFAAYEGVRAYGPLLETASITTLHELRIAGKWLRYSMEFVREALGSDVDELIARVTAIQDHLGLMHDADVAAALARSFLAEHSDSLGEPTASAIERYVGRKEEERDRLVTSLGPPFKAVDGSAFRRRLGRALAEL